MFSVLALSLLVLTPPAPSPALAGEGRAPAQNRDVDQLADQVRALVASDALEDAATMLALLDRGLPPVALASFLAATAHHPRTIYAHALHRLLRYRRVEVRGRAVVSLVALGGADARAALLDALDDLNPQIRELGVKLAGTYTDPRVEDALLSLRARQPDLFPDASAEGEPVWVVEVDAPAPEAETETEDLVLAEVR